MSVMEKLSSPVMYAICGSIVAFVAVVCVVFAVRAWRAGRARNICFFGLEGKRQIWYICASQSEGCLRSPMQRKNKLKNREDPP